MSSIQNKIIFFLALPLLVWNCRVEPQAVAEEITTIAKQTSSSTALVAPEKLYGALFEAVQLAKIFPDGKTFVDCRPKTNPASIKQAYDAASKESDFELKTFVAQHFDMPFQHSSGFQSDRSLNVEQHIERLWEVLERESDSVQVGTLIPLPHPYIVPGGRFGEVYYWDSYFTMLGLEVSGRTETIEYMVDNFAHLIDVVGFIPNGNRTYYLTRSQPPFFAAMVQLLARTKKDESVIAHYLTALEKEYAFWMDGKDRLNEKNTAVQHLVQLEDGSILNRYFDKGTSPRAEMYADDVEIIEKAGRKTPEMASAIRAACESGWDFSSRWFDDAATLGSINTTAIIAPDLNALLYNLEKTIAQAYQIKGNTTQAKTYEALAEMRKVALDKYCWDAASAFYRDYNFNTKTITATPSLAGAYPLYFKMATETQAKGVRDYLQKNFLRPGGLPCTQNNTGQQWDAPNGWAPLQWIAIQGLRNYGHQELANTIKTRWVKLNVDVYERTGKMVEKYNVEDLSLEAGGGEYPVQDGFGWSNGVLLRLLKE